ncbi:MAG: flavodoxin family protein [Planctomycetes bacterium]|nr:flavodoxin family protein [Planctomycetota bacterium]
MEGVRVLAISTSPRRGGNSEALLDRAVSGALCAGAEVEKVILHDFQVSPCLEKRGCEKTGECVIQDDYPFFYERFLSVDRIIMACPVYFMGVPAQAKALVDRCQCIWMRKYRLKKRIEATDGVGRRGYLVSAGAFKSPGTFDCLMKVMKYFYLTLDMEFAGDVCIDGVDAKGDIEKHPQTLEAAYRLGAAAGTP